MMKRFGGKTTASMFANSKKNRGKNRKISVERITEIPVVPYVEYIPECVSIAALVRSVDDAELLEAAGAGTSGDANELRSVLMPTIRQVRKTKPPAHPRGGFFIVGRSRGNDTLPNEVFVFDVERRMAASLDAFSFEQLCFMPINEEWLGRRGAKRALGDLLWWILVAVRTVDWSLSEQNRWKEGTQ